MVRPVSLHKDWFSFVSTIERRRYALYSLNSKISTSRYPPLLHWRDTPFNDSAKTGRASVIVSNKRSHGQRMSTCPDSRARNTLQRLLRPRTRKKVGRLNHYGPAPDRCCAEIRNRPQTETYSRCNRRNPACSARPRFQYRHFFDRSVLPVPRC